MVQSESCDDAHSDIKQRSQKPPKNIFFPLKNWKWLFRISGGMLFKYTKDQNADNNNNYRVWFGCIWFVCSWSYSSSKVVSSSPPRKAESHRDVKVCASANFWPRSVNMLRVQDSWELLHVVEDHSVEWFTMNNQVICLKKMWGCISEEVLSITGQNVKTHFLSLNIIKKSCEQRSRDDSLLFKNKPECFYFNARAHFYVSGCRILLKKSI